MRYSSASSRSGVLENSAMFLFMVHSKSCSPYKNCQALRVTCRYVRIWDEEDEALQPEWEIDPRDLQILEKV